MTPRELSLCPGQRAEFECNVTRNGATRRWTVNGDSVAGDYLSTNGQYLAIPAVNLSDAGTYVCTASADAESESSKAELRVTPELPTATASPKTAVVDQGSDVEFSCSVQGCPEPSIQWLAGLSGLPANARQQGGRLILTSVQPDTPTSYLCRATSPFGSGDDNTILVVRSTYNFLSDTHGNYSLVEALSW